MRLQPLRRADFFGAETGFLEPARSGEEMFRETYETNVIAPNELTQVMLPLLQKSPAGRIVNQSSIIGSLTTIASDEQAAAWAGPACASSKAALNMLTVLQATRLKGSKVKVNSAHPGWVKTDLGGQNAPMDVITGAKTAVRLAQLGAEGPSGKFFLCLWMNESRRRFVRFTVTFLGASALGSCGSPGAPSGGAAVFLEAGPPGAAVAR